METNECLIDARYAMLKYRCPRASCPKLLLHPRRVKTTQNEEQSYRVQARIVFVVFA